MKTIRLLSAIMLSASLLSAQPKAVAQEGDYFEMEDPEEFIEPIPEPYYEEEPIDDFEMGEPPPPPPPPPPDGLDSQAQPPNARPSFRAQKPQSRPSATTAKSGDIEFRLMDPPKYYVGEKKPVLPKPKNLRK